MFLRRQKPRQALPTKTSNGSSTLDLSHSFLRFINDLVYFVLRHDTVLVKNTEKESDRSSAQF